MSKLKVRELSVEGFLPFGFYASMTNPDSESLGASPIMFYRDMLQQDMGGAAMPSFSVCRVEKRPFVIDVSEFHTATGEGTLPLDNDVIIHVAPATADPAVFPAEKAQLFRVPKGTMVVLRPGVWHHAAFTVNAKPANVLIVLPERTYARDCFVVSLKKKISFSL
jgi:ureidoglycolate lyase